MDEEKNNLNQNTSEEFNQIPQMDSNDSTERLPEPKKEGVVGPIIGSIIIIIMIIVGGVYFLNSFNERRSDVQTEDQNQASNEIDGEISEIESDLEIPELDNLDAELDDIQAEINAELN